MWTSIGIFGLIIHCRYPYVVVCYWYMRTNIGIFGLIFTVDIHRLLYAIGICGLILVYLG